MRAFPRQLSFAFLIPSEDGLLARCGVRLDGPTWMRSGSPSSRLASDSTSSRKVALNITFWRRADIRDSTPLIS